MSALGLDVGGTAVKWVLLGPDGGVLAAGAYPTPRDGADAVADSLASTVERLRHTHPSVPPAGIGVGVPGHVDRDTGVTRFIPNLPGDWAGYPLAAAVATRCAGPQIPVRVLNDARAFGLAELRLGAARGLRNVVFVTLGTGVGGALALDGRLIVGPLDRTGEIGHQTYDATGPLCGCGNAGCVEAYASGPALLAEARTRAQGPGVPAVQPVESVERLAELADGGDPAARAAFLRAGRALGVVLSSTCALMGAEAVVVGGGVGRAFRHLHGPIADAFAGRRPMLGDIAIRAAELGDRAGALGAALWAEEGAGTTR